MSSTQSGVGDPSRSTASFSAGEPIHRPSAPRPDKSEDFPRLNGKLSRAQVGLKWWSPPWMRTTLGVFGLLAFLAFWETAARTGLVDPLYVSAPSRVWEAGVSYVSSPEFGPDVAASLRSFLYGIGLGLLVGIPLGVLTGWYRPVDYMLRYLIDFLYAMPRIALVPILILWFGIGVQSNIAIVFLLTVFPIHMGTSTGIRTVDSSLVRVGHSLAAKDWQIFTMIALPASIPSIVSGIRNAISLGIVGVVVGEFLASTSGVGRMIQEAANNYQADYVFVGLMIFSISGVVFNELVRAIEKRLDRWRPGGN